MMYNSEVLGFHLKKYIYNLKFIFLSPTTNALNVWPSWTIAGFPFIKRRGKATTAAAATATPVLLFPSNEKLRLTGIDWRKY